MNHHDALSKRLKAESEENWREWSNKMEFIDFKDEWKIRIVPPFTGAMVRFQITTEDIDGSVSVYLDCHSNLGVTKNPYWEVYNYEEPPERILYEEGTEKLLELIEDKLNKLR